MSFRKRKEFTEIKSKHSKKHRTSSKGINFYIPLHKLDLSDDTNTNKKFTNKTVQMQGSSSVPEPITLHIKEPVQIKEPIKEEVVSSEKTYSQTEVTALLAKQQKDFRSLLEEKLREQFLMFNHFYMNNVFKEYENSECSYIV